MLSGDDRYEFFEKEIIALVHSDDTEDVDCETIQPKWLHTMKGLKLK